jgi:hypothetical protein
MPFGPVVGLVHIQFVRIGYPGTRGQAIAPFERNPFRQILEGFAPVLPDDPASYNLIDQLTGR